MKIVKKFCLIYRNIPNLKHIHNRFNELSVILQTFLIQKATTCINRMVYKQTGVFSPRPRLWAAFKQTYSHSPLTE
jgi:hypothetical protein